MAHDLQPEQAARDGAGPQEKEEADDPEARLLERQSPYGLSAAAGGLDGCRHVSF
jgi:hypothetical protein